MTDPRSLRAILCTGLFALATAASAAGPASPVVHPEAWPKAKSPPLVDAATEAKITALLGQMSLAEKVGQVVQGDIGSVKPQDLREYPLGSVLAGGNSGPYDDERASPQTSTTPGRCSPSRSRPSCARPASPTPTSASRS